jgi:hypothetical protein
MIFKQTKELLRSIIFYSVFVHRSVFKKNHKKIKKFQIQNDPKYDTS